MSLLYIDRDKIFSSDTLTKEIFLNWYPGEFDKWEAFKKIRHDWLSKYGRLKGYQRGLHGKKISFLGKLKWAFKFIDEMNHRRK